MPYTIEQARDLLNAADVFFHDDDDPKMAQTINLNDVWGWASADGQYVADEEMPQVAYLFWKYGWCGILYWCSEQEGQCRSEFHDVNRFIDIVRKEEELVNAEPSSSKRAYTKLSYTIGEPVV